MLKTAIEELTKQGDWALGNVQRRVTQFGDLPPFSRWFKPTSTVDLIGGNVTLVSAFQMETLRDLSLSRGVRISWRRREEDLFPIEFTSDFIENHPQFEFQKINICDWHRLRVMYAFLAVETFVEIVSFFRSEEGLSALVAKLPKKLQASNEEGTPGA